MGGVEIEWIEIGWVELEWSELKRVNVGVVESVFVLSYECVVEEFF